MDILHTRLPREGAAERLRELTINTQRNPNVAPPTKPEKDEPYVE